MPASLGVNRNLNTLSVSAAATIGPDVDQVICNATSAGFTLTLTDYSDGALHQVEIIMSPSDSSGNTVTVQGNATAFSTTLASGTTSSALLQTQANGTWFVVGDVSSTSTGAAASEAISAGAAAAVALSAATSGTTLAASEATSAGAAGAVALSAATSGTTETRSEATSAGAAGAVALSAATSGTTETRSEATSAGAAGAVALSAAVSAGAAASSAMSLAAS